MSWYAIYTTPHSGKKTAQRLTKYSDVEVFLPLISEKRVWSDRIRSVARPMFSSYVFIKTAEHRLRDLLVTEGVVRVVYYEGKPAVILDKEIVQIQRFVELSGSCTIEKGDTVEILMGAFKSISGKVQKIGKTHLYLFLEQLGVRLCVKIENSKKIG